MTTKTYAFAVLVKSLTRNERQALMDDLEAAGFGIPCSRRRVLAMLDKASWTYYWDADADDPTLQQDLQAIKDDYPAAVFSHVLEQ